MDNNYELISLLRAIYRLLDTRLKAKHEINIDRLDKLFNRKEAAEYLMVSPRTVNNWCRMQILQQSTTRGKRALYHQADLDRCYEWYWGKPK